MYRAKDRSRIEFAILVNPLTIQFVVPRGPKFGSSLLFPAAVTLATTSSQVAQVLVLPYERSRNDTNFDRRR
jgi:hypothetical protein